TVGERPPVGNRDREVLAVLGLDGLRHLVLGLPLGGGVDELGVDVVEDASAADLVGVQRVQRVLRLGGVEQGDAPTASTTVAATVTVTAVITAAGGQRHRCASRRRAEPH